MISATSTSPEETHAAKLAQQIAVSKEILEQLPDLRAKREECLTRLAQLRLQMGELLAKTSQENGKLKPLTGILSPSETAHFATLVSSVANPKSGIAQMDAIFKQKQMNLSVRTELKRLKDALAELKKEKERLEKAIADSQ